MFKKLLAFISSGTASVYADLLRLRLKKHNPHKVKSSLPIISVGNLTVGGTGKTPLVVAICEHLLNAEKIPAIVTRGYAGVNQDGELLADEPLMLGKKLPRARIVINPDRNAGIRTAIEAGSDAVVLDDAFQNLKINKDLDIVCVNCLNAFGNLKLLPAGPLRLPLEYLKLADVFMLTHAASGKANIPEIKRVLREFNPQALVCESVHAAEGLYDLAGRKRQLLPLQGERVALLCALAAPEGFYQTVKEINADPVLKFAFSDHHVYTEAELEKIGAECSQKNITTILTTDKDAVKLSRLEGAKRLPGIRVLNIKLKIIKNEQEFFNRVDLLFTV